MFGRQIFGAHAPGILQQGQVLRVERIAHLSTSGIDAQAEEITKQVGKVVKAEFGNVEMQLVDPEQLAPLVSYLLSPSSGVITGAMIDYDQQIVGAMPE